MTTSKSAAEVELWLQDVGGGLWTTSNEPRHGEKPGTVWNYPGFQVPIPHGTIVVNGIRSLTECSDGIAVVYEGQPYWLVVRFDDQKVRVQYILFPRSLEHP